MRQFIKLKDYPDGIGVNGVNFAHVVRFWRLSDEKPGIGTTILELAGGDHLRVLETPEEIFALLEQVELQ